MRVMIVDDSRSSLAQLKAMVEQFDAVEAATFLDPELALEDASTQRFDLAIIDHIMPKFDGITLIGRMRNTRFHRQVPMVMVTATGEDAVKMRALEAGATDFLSKSQSRLELTIKLRNIISLADALRRLDDHVASQAREIERATQSLLLREEEMVFCLSKALEYRDTDTNDHTCRVASYSRMIAEKLGLSERECRSVYMASPLHDIGKVAIPDGILLKPGKLDDGEREIIKTHAAIGARILSDSNSELINLAAEIAESHHERWDGKGYPNGLAGEAIPLCARIVAIADVFDALTTERPYKKALPLGEALSVLEAERGRHFDPVCLDAFLSAIAALVEPGPAFPLEALLRRLGEAYPARSRTPERLT
ncbi:MAG TPA: HD domain-containing phosphohydrolase [Roseiarcus sp.]|jgi:putative two-component system response regulator